jgi:hypothetical protein
LSFSQFDLRAVLRRTALAANHFLPSASATTIGRYDTLGSVLLKMR